MIAAAILSVLVMIAPVEPPSSHVVSGLVINASTHTPVYGATISLPSGKRLALTDKMGRFRAILPTVGWPTTIKIGAPNLATHDTELPYIPSDTDLKQIMLSLAARIHIIAPPALTGVKLRWQLKRLIAGKAAGINSEGSFSAGRSDVTLDNVESANYVLLLIGPKPLQQAVTKIVVKTGASIELPINITPVTLNLTVVEGGKPIADAVVDLASTDLIFRGIVTCDEHGAATEEMWQRGDFWATLMAHDRASFGRFVHLDSDTGSIDWTFVSPAHHVRGRVIDSATEEPLRGVKVRVNHNAPAEGGREGASATTDDDGRFDLSAIKTGSHELTSYLKGYRYDHPLQFTLEEEDGDYETTVRLEKIVDAHFLTVIDWNNVAVAGADMFLATPSGVLLLEHSDESGHVTIPPGREGVAFAVPRGGSFGFTYIPPDLSEDLSLHIQRPSGTLDILSRSTSGEAIPNIYFMFRINGTVVPEEVFSRFAGLNSLSIRTDETGHAFLPLLPPGLYEFWPTRSSSEIAAIMGGHAPEPAASVVVGDTPQVVTLTFRKNGKLKQQVRYSRAP